LQKKRQYAEIDERRQASKVNVESIKQKLEPIEVSRMRRFIIFNQFDLVSIGIYYKRKFENG
jgi:hypothetical protein